MSAAIDDAGEVVARYVYGPQDTVAMVLKTDADGRQHLSYQARNGLGDVAGVAYVPFNSSGQPGSGIRKNFTNHFVSVRRGGCFNLSAVCARS